MGPPSYTVYATHDVCGLSLTETSLWGTWLQNQKSAVQELKLWKKRWAVSVNKEKSGCYSSLSSYHLLSVIWLWHAIECNLEDSPERLCTEGTPETQEDKGGAPSVTWKAGDWDLNLDLRQLERSRQYLGLEMEKSRWRAVNYPLEAQKEIPIIYREEASADLSNMAAMRHVGLFKLIKIKWNLKFTSSSHYPHSRAQRPHVATGCHLHRAGMEATSLPSSQKLLLLSTGVGSKEKFLESVSKCSKKNWKWNFQFSNEKFNRK